MKINGAYYRQMQSGEMKLCRPLGHRYAYSGRIPCTGPKVCIYCGKEENDTELVIDPEYGFQKWGK